MEEIIQCLEFDSISEERGKGKNDENTDHELSNVDTENSDVRVLYIKIIFKKWND